jgi:hypothetical protein
MRFGISFHMQFKSNPQTLDSRERMHDLVHSPQSEGTQK